MWIFSGKDSKASGGSIGLNFGGDPVPGFSLDSPVSPDSCPTVFDGPYGLHWKRRDAHRKKPNEEVCIFTCALPTGISADDSELIRESLAKTVKWMKTLRHPNILSWIASTEISGTKLPAEFHIVTERVVPLREYLRLKADTGNFTFMSSWGIHQIARALAFLNDDAKTAHNAVRLDAIFVTAAGEWKLGGLDYASPINEEAPVYPSTVSGSGTDPYSPPDHRMVDSWGLGCLIWEIFNPECTLRDRAQLTSQQSLERLPDNLVPDYRRLLAPSATRGAKRRLTVADFRSRARNPNNGFFANQYVDTLLFLEEIQLKDTQEKSRFLTKLGDLVNTFPDDVCRHKILPHLVNGLRYGSAGAEALIPVLRLIPLLSESDFNATVLPCLVQLFASPERSTRVRLLEQLPNFVKHLPPKIVETQIFPPVANGFSDSNPIVREATVRAMIHLAPKLSGKLLNESVPRHLIILQTKDDQGGIRANATVCLAKLAPLFSTQTRRGTMLSALLRVTRDPFVPSRQAAVTALAATQGYYQVEQLSGKLLPCLSFLTVDPEKTIRDDVFRAIRGILERLEQASENPGMDESNMQEGETEEKGTAAGRGAASALGHWALSALSFSSKLLSSTTATSQPSSQAPQQASNITVQDLAKPTAITEAKKSEPYEQKTEEDETSFTEDESPRIAAKPMHIGAAATKNDEDWLSPAEQGDQWTMEDEGWGALEDDFPTQSAIGRSERLSKNRLSESDRDRNPIIDKLNWDPDEFLNSLAANSRPMVTGETRISTINKPSRKSHTTKQSNPKKAGAHVTHTTSPKASRQSKQDVKPKQEQVDDSDWGNW
ncbi:unnamed protein product [Calicophoron daubneyi]|uniref:N-terminal kinase-like protein n=1 Tax=Calicophoron daubneyi TaxID=300641 RepID=A0AAV2TJ45_CALDB